MSFTREKMISCWDMELREFDKALVKDTHLIRSELSLNKKGYKTFLGYSHKDVSFIPQHCNKNNNIKPAIGEVVFSAPEDINFFVEDFFYTLDNAKMVKKVKRKEFNLARWTNPEAKGLRGCVEFILSDKFKDFGDGHRRGMFILANELKKFNSQEEVLNMLLSWKELVGMRLPDREIEYRVYRSKEYSLPCQYVHEFLSEVGVKDIVSFCKRKV